MDTSFEALGIAEPLLRALGEEGYEAPTPIQARAIPALLAGRDVLGQAQTGTGKTAAFALPMLQRLALEPAALQGLVLTPTRELAIQVAEAIHTYGRHLPGVRVAPIYGGQPMPTQIRRLQMGLHVVVGTPGRLLDHRRRGTLDLSAVTFVVLDEGDEMLRMGFIDDVETILGDLPETHQTALFSATMPAEIARIAERHLHDPVRFEIDQRAVTVPTIDQRYLNVGDRQKLDALARILDVEDTDAVLVFVRTKTGAAELTERLQHRGWDAEAMHGDMSQAQREQVVRRLRGGQVDIVVATDVAARGLDVERISHVVNHDIPYDPESYVHRVGRTARAGRPGVSVLFVTPRQTRLLREIERYTGQRITPMKMPTQADVAARRVELFKESLKTAIAEGNLEPYLALVEELAEEGPYDIAEVAAAAARLAGGDRPLELVADGEAGRDGAAGDATVRLFINAGREQGLRPADVVGAIANEAGIPGAAITGVDIHDRFTFLEIPARYQDQVLTRMGGSTIRNRPVSVTVALPREAPGPWQPWRAAERPAAPAARGTVEPGTAPRAPHIAEQPEVAAAPPAVEPPAVPAAPETAEQRAVPGPPDTAEPPAAPPAAEPPTVPGAADIGAADISADDEAQRAGPTAPRPDRRESRAERRMRERREQGKGLSPERGEGETVDRDRGGAPTRARDGAPPRARPDREAAGEAPPRPPRAERWTGRGADRGSRGGDIDRQPRDRWKAPPDRERPERPDRERAGRPGEDRPERGYGGRERGGWQGRDRAPRWSAGRGEAPPPGPDAGRWRERRDVAKPPGGRGDRPRTGVWRRGGESPRGGQPPRGAERPRGGQWRGAERPRGPERRGEQRPGGERFGPPRSGPPRPKERWRAPGGRSDRPGDGRYEPPWKKRRSDVGGDRPPGGEPRSDRPGAGGEQPRGEEPPAERPFYERFRPGGRWKPKPGGTRPFRKRRR